jgi:hypothetical protein
MDVRGKLKDEPKHKDSDHRDHFQHQSFAESAVNALQQRALLDVDSEP